MLPRLFLRSACLIALTIAPTISVDCFAEEPHGHGEGSSPSTHAEHHGIEAPQSPDARPQMVKIGPKGVSPAQLTMLQSDSIVFFYNDTEDDLATLEVEFGPRVVHCSAALKIVKEPGLARSRKPFGPKEFASTCFHDKGQYTYRVYTSRKGQTPYTGTVTVQ